MKLMSNVRVCSLLSLTVLLTTSNAGAQQVCDGLVPSSAPTHRFVVNDDGTVLDNRTSRVWMRCAVGSELDNNDTPTVISDDRCVVTDTELFRWEEALNYASNLNATGGFAGVADWRLPNIKELMALVERQCVSPAMNAAVFPETVLESQFWSSTPDVLSSAYVVDFRDGTNALGRRLTASYRVRLVR